MQKHARRSLLDEQAYELILSDFDEVRDAQTLDQLTEARNAFMEHWEDSHPKLCDYLDEKLSAEHLWVNAYINRHPHMGTRVTSRAEGAHATLKNWLHSRHGSLFVVTQALKNHFVVQQTGISSDLENDRAKIPVTLLGDPFFVQVSRTVSRHALNLIKHQDEMSRRPKNRTPAPATPACACILPPTMGLPCFHALARLRAAGKPIPLDFIHPQWRTAAGLIDDLTSEFLDFWIHCRPANAESQMRLRPRPPLPEESLQEMRLHSRCTLAGPVGAKTAIRPVTIRASVRYHVGAVKEIISLVNVPIDG
ncbi:hypothetical protein CF326_g9350 [Tilletia indica]|nr:hypothetical protein CF326_g9350 [Tilletia indica]